MSEYPKVSVIISAYNSEKFLKGRIDNLIQQTIFQSCEIIIVISGSTQHEESIIKEYQKYYSNIVYQRTEKRETIYQAWNRCIALSRGKYIVNANTDDRSRYDALEIFSKTLDAHPDVAMVYADQYISSIPNGTFNTVSVQQKSIRPEYTRLRLLSGYHLGSQQMWRASLHFDDGMWFDESFEICGDYDFACRVAEKYTILLVKDVLGIYYLSKEKENKQFQDIDRFFNEDALVQEKYVQRYLDNLPQMERDRLYNTAKYWLWLPKIVYALLHRWFYLVNPRNQIIPKYFWIWMNSLIEEDRGDMDKSMMVCKRYLHAPDARLIQRRYDKLINSNKRNDKSIL